MQNTLPLFIALVLSFGVIVFWSWDAVIQTHAIRLLDGSILASFCF